MNTYQTELEAIVDLHDKGFVYDFQLAGSNLVWIQEKIPIRAGDFAVVECHRFNSQNDESKAVAILGILSLEHNIKGILIDHAAGMFTENCAYRWSNQYNNC